MALIAANIAYWPATPRMKSMRPAIAERLDNPDIGYHFVVCDVTVWFILMLQMQYLQLKVFAFNYLNYLFKCYST